jgi:hypothetical protein
VEKPSEMRSSVEKRVRFAIGYHERAQNYGANQCVIYEAFSP